MGGVGEEFKFFLVSWRASQRGLVTCPKIHRKAAAAGARPLISLCFLVTSGREHRECGQTQVHWNLTSIFPVTYCPPRTQVTCKKEEDGGMRPCVAQLSLLELWDKLEPHHFAVLACSC